MKTVRLGPDEKLRDMTFILLTGKLVGNNEVLLAWLLAYSENSADIVHLLRTMAANDIIIDRKEVTMVSDRGSALIKSYEDFFTKASHKYCDLHITRPMPPAWGSHTYYWMARNAPTKLEHDVAMARMRAACPAMHAHLSKFTHWAMYEFIEKGCMLYDIKSSNIVEGRRIL